MRICIDKVKLFYDNCFIKKVSNVIMNKVTKFYENDFIKWRLF